VHAEPNPTSYIYPTPTGDRTTLPVSSHNSKIVAHDGMAVRAGTGRNLSQCCVPSTTVAPMVGVRGFGSGIGGPGVGGGVARLIG